MQTSRSLGKEWGYIVRGENFLCIFVRLFPQIDSLEGLELSLWNIGSNGSKVYFTSVVCLFYKDHPCKKICLQLPSVYRYIMPCSVDTYV